jgi:hypothetical protein
MISNLLKVVWEFPAVTSFCVIILVVAALGYLLLRLVPAVGHSPLVILAVTRTPTSLLKTVYFLFFAFTVPLIFINFASHSDQFWKSIPIRPESPGDYRVFFSVIIWYAVSLFFHFLRLYVSLELLENPCSEFFSKYLLTMRPSLRGWESLLRIVLLILVTFKLVHQFTGMQHLAIYLASIYLVLLFWDVLMIRGQGLGLAETYFYVSCPNFIFSALLYVSLTCENYTIMIVFMVLLAFSTTVSLVWDLYRNHSEYALFFSGIKEDVIMPHDGQRCTYKIVDGGGRQIMKVDQCLLRDRLAQKKGR